jgi:hypothetical protein
MWTLREQREELRANVVGGNPAAADPAQLRAIRVAEYTEEFMHA